MTEFERLDQHAMLLERVRYPSSDTFIIVTNISLCADDGTPVVHDVEVRITGTARESDGITVHEVEAVSERTRSEIGVIYTTWYSLDIRGNYAERAIWSEVLDQADDYISPLAEQIWEEVG